MITGAHTVIYSRDADALRAWFRDVLEFPYVDAHGGWLIFALPPAEVAVHPAEGTGSEEGTRPGHELFLMCDDIDETVSRLRSRGVEFTTAITEQSWGRLISVKTPDGGHLGLYQPRHPLAPHDEASGARASN